MPGLLYLINGVKVPFNVPVLIRGFLNFKERKERVRIYLVNVNINRFNVINLYHVSVSRNEWPELRGLEVKVSPYVRKYL